MPVVVADRVLDVPHIRQEQSQWCWVACAQMAIQKYEPDNNKIQHWLVEEERRASDEQNSVNNPDNSAGYMSEICSIVEREVDNVQGKYISNPQNMTDHQLRQILDSGSPVIYLMGRYNTNGSRRSGHIRVIYGYYINTDGDYVYLVHEPWKTCNKKFGLNGAVGNNIHLDIWRRSLVNIKDENEAGISSIDNPNDDIYGYELEEVLYFEEVN